MVGIDDKDAKPLFTLSVLRQQLCLKPAGEKREVMRICDGIIQHVLCQRPAKKEVPGMFDDGIECNPGVLQAEGCLYTIVISKEFIRGLACKCLST